MLTNNTAYITAATALAREPDVKIYINDTESRLTYILVEKDSVNFGGSLFGNALPQTLKMVVRGNVSFDTGTKIDIDYLFSGLSAGFVHPEFYVTEISYDVGTNQTTITAKDRLEKLINEKFDAKTDGTLSADEFFAMFCNAFGFVAGNIDSERASVIMPQIPNFAESDNALVVLSKFAEFMCCNAYIKNRNQLHLSSPISEKSVSLDIQRGVANFITKDIAPINRVVLSRGDANDNVYLPKTDPEIITEYAFINNPFFDNSDMTDSRDNYIDSLYSALNGKAFTGYELSYRGNPIMECGDIFTVEGGKKLVYFGEKLTMQGGMKGTTKIGYTHQTNKSFSSGTMKEMLREVSLKVDKANGEISMEISAANADIAKLKEDYAESEILNQGRDDKLGELEALYSSLKEDLTGFTFDIGALQEAVGETPEQLVNTVVTIDINGVTVGRSGVDIKTNISAEGLEINNTGGGKVARFNNEGATISNVTTKVMNVAGTMFRTMRDSNGKLWGAAFWIGEDDLWD